MENKDRKPILPEKYRIPALILALGLVLMLLPGLSRKEQAAAGPEEKLQAVLCETCGVGEARVLISDTGVVIICAGADDPRVRLDILRAVGSYTGFGSDKITVLKMADQS